MSSVSISDYPARDIRHTMGWGIWALKTFFPNVFVGMRVGGGVWENSAAQLSFALYSICLIFLPCCFFIAKRVTSATLKDSLLVAVELGGSELAQGLRQKRVIQMTH